MSDESESGRPAPEEPVGVGIDSHHADEAIYEPFNPGPLPIGKASDGLPSIITSPKLPIVAPLSEKTFICMADRSSYVLRDGWGEVIATFTPDEVNRAPSGDYYVRCPEALKLQDRKSTRLNSSHRSLSRMPSSA